MSDEPLADSSFTDREMRVIFERAGRLDALSARERRYSLAELQEMGAQAGLDPADVARAAHSVRVVTATHRLLGEPTRFRSSLRIDHRMSDAGLNVVVEKLREATGYHGDLRMATSGVEWRARGPLGAFIVDVTPRREGTQFNVLVAADDDAVLTVLASGAVGLAMGAAVGVAVATQFHAGMAVPLVAGFTTGTGALWATTRLLWRRAAERWRRRLDAVTRAISSGAALPSDPAE